MLFLGLGRNAILVANARVPIISFQDMQHNISCDVSVENDAAVLKSRLLRWIGMIDSRCRDLIFLVNNYFGHSWIILGYFHL